MSGDFEIGLFSEFVEGCQKAFSKTLKVSDIEKAFLNFMESFGLPRGALLIYCPISRTCFHFFYDSVFTSRRYTNSDENECFQPVERATSEDGNFVEKIVFEDKTIGYIYLHDIKSDELPEKVKIGLLCLRNLIIFYMFQRKYREMRLKYSLALQGPSRTLSQISKMMHDLKTPLATIMAAADLIISAMLGPLNESQKKYLQMIKDSSSQLSIMLDDLMDMARLRLSSIELRMATFSIKETVEEVVKAFEGQILDKKLHIKTAFAGNEYVVADPRRIKQVLYNIISNAIKYTPPGGSIIIRAASDDEGFKVVVEDTGPGIPHELIEELMDESSKSENLPAGLFIVKRLVDYHGGRVEIKAEEGKGTKFAFYIPSKRKNSREVFQDEVQLDEVDKI